jgi:hypothetical protein
MAKQLEYVYELKNLPKFKTLCKPELDLKQFFSTEYIRFGKITEIFQEHKDIFNNIKFTNHLSFCKGLKSSGKIHTDNDIRDPITLRWGLNWVIGDGIMEYWDLDHTDGSEYKTDSAGNTRPEFIVSKPPSKSYFLKDDHVYLINGTVPHRAINTGTTTRYAFSVRTHHVVDPMIKWEDIVNKFNNYIV